MFDEICSHDRFGIFTDVRPLSGVDLNELNVIPVGISCRMSPSSVQAIDTDSSSVVSFEF